MARDRHRSSAKIGGNFRQMIAAAAMQSLNLAAAAANLIYRPTRR
jgi:hypothetical protein